MRMTKQALLGLGLGATYLAVRSLKSRYELDGRIALVTGGSRGLGLEVARCLVEDGASAAICARDPSELKRAEVDLHGRGGKVLAFVCDVTRQADVRRVVREVNDAWGEIDVLVNNAGVISVGPLRHMTKDDFETSMDTHFWGPYYFIDAVLDSMRRRGEGRIVNVASVGGRVGVPHLVPYCAGKFALVGFSEGLRAELAAHGIRVTTVCPGLMRTGSPRRALFKGQHRAEHAWFAVANSLPLLTVSSRRAAKSIVRAIKDGSGMVQMSLVTKIAGAAQALLPGLVGAVAAMVNRMLPSEGGIGEEARTGANSSSAWAPSPLTVLTERAARANNEM